MLYNSSAMQELEQLLELVLSTPRLRLRGFPSGRSLVMSPSPPRIICKAGPNLQSLKPLKVNDGALSINGDDFEGAVAVRIQDYHGPAGESSKSSPDTAFSGHGDTWSIQIEGRFKDEVQVDQVVSESERAASEKLQRTTADARLPLTDVRQLLGEAYQGSST